MSIKDESNIVQVEAAEGGIELLNSITFPVALNFTDVRVFQLYIFPAYKVLGVSSSRYVKTCFLKLIGNICHLGSRFVEQGVMRKVEHVSEKNEGIGGKIGKRLSISYCFTDLGAIEVNPDNEIGEVSNELVPILFNCIDNLPSLYLVPLTENLREIALFIGQDKFESITSILLKAISNEDSELLRSILNVVPEISKVIGTNWISKIITDLKFYIHHKGELMIYSFIKCFKELVEYKLLPKGYIVLYYAMFSPFLVHPNKWLKTAAIKYCMEAGNSLTDIEFFISIRTELLAYVKHYIPISKTKSFEEFLYPSISRLFIDLNEAGINNALDITIKEGLILAAFKEKHKLEDLKVPDKSKLNKDRYDNYMRVIKNLFKTTQLERIDFNTKKQDFNFDIFEIENTDIHYIVHKVPLSHLFNIDNNGLNNVRLYDNYLVSHSKSNNWKAIYKKLILYQPLKYYVQEDVVEQRVSIVARKGKLWRPQGKPWRPQGRLITVINAHKEAVRAISVSEDTNLMATGANDGTCCIWNTSSLKHSIVMKQKDQIEVDGSITSLRFLNNDDLILATNKGSISLYKLESQSFSSLIVRGKDDFAVTEGGIVNCYPYLRNQGHNTLVYATHQGKIHIHDIRSKRDVSSFSFEKQRGLISCFSIGQDENNFFIGTINGYIATYDIRFNLVTNTKRHSRGAPITDMCCYSSERYLPKSLYPPKLFVASSADTSQVDLYSMNQSAPEWSFVIGNSRFQYKAYTPYKLKEDESIVTDINNNILKRLTKGFPVSNEEVKKDIVIEDSNFAFKNFYKSVKNSYDEGTWIYKLLCPRINRTEESAPFLLTTGADRTIRYWYLGNLTEDKININEMIKQSFIVNSPNFIQVEYFVNGLHSKVLYEDLNRDAQGGQSICQTFNGKAYLKNEEQAISSVSHSDAILNMELLDLAFDTYLVTCGRDNEVKVWC